MTNDQLTKEDGFTLIEVLVAINVAFIGLTVIITFYLFMSKFIFSSGKKIETSQMIYDSFYKIENILKSCEEYNIRISQDSIVFIIDNKEKIIFQNDKVKLSDMYTIEDLYEVNITFFRMAGTDKLNWQYSGSEQDTGERDHGSEVTEQMVSSKEISGFNIEIEKNKINYSWKYYTPAISANRFNNLIDR